MADARTVSLVRQSRADYPSDRPERGKCHMCDRGEDREHIASPLWDLGVLGHLIPADHYPSIPRLCLCADCRADCTELYRAALDLVIDGAQRTIDDPRGRRQLLSVQLMAQRIALLRALSAMTPTTRQTPIGRMCRWCDNLTCIADETVTLKCLDLAFIPQPSRGTAADVRLIREADWYSICLHKRCLTEAEAVNHEEARAAVMASGALRLPLLPEVCRQVASFIYQVALASPTAANCPVFMASAPWWAKCQPD